MTHPRGLSAEEAEAWERLAKTVVPLRKVARKNPPPPGEVSSPSADGAGAAVAPPSRFKTTSTTRSASGPPRPMGEDLAPGKGLDSHWERRLARASTDPDFTLDLHGHTLDQAYRRLDSGLTQAKAMGARMVLVVTGKSRPVDAADRGTKRGAIRAKILDWLAAGQHASDIAAIRNAHRRHGGDGAIYLVLKRRR